MLSDYRWRKLKREQVRRSYQELKHDQALIVWDKLLIEFEQAFIAWHGRKPLKAERPNGKKRIINSTKALWARVHEREITDGLDCDLSR